MKGLRVVVLALFVLLILGTASASIAPKVEWEKKFGYDKYDTANDVKQTSDGGYIVAGETYNGEDTDAWIIKLDSNGNVIWEKKFGGSNWDNANAIQQTSDGGYIFAGTYTNESDNLDVQAWIVKLDANGNVIWEKKFGGNGSDGASAIQQTKDGGYIFAGTYNHERLSPYIPSEDYDMWIVKLDANGNIVWEKKLGGPYMDYANAIQQTSDGGYIVAGVYECVENDIHHDEAWVIKLDSNGNVVWKKKLGGNESVWWYANDVKQTSDGGYIVVGQIYDHRNLNSSALIVKLDANGNIIWEKRLGEGEMNGANAVQQTKDGGYVVAGVWTNTSVIWLDTQAWIIKLDSNGNVVWEKKLGDNCFDGANSIQQTKDGGYIVAGWYCVVSDNQDAWVIKLGGGGGLGILKMEPSTNSPKVNDTFTVDVVVKNAGSIMAMTADVVNTSNVDYIGVEKYPDGWIKLSDNPIRVFTMDSSKAIDTTNGATILTLKFKALSEGNATINLSNITVKDTNGNLITIPPSSLTIFISKSIIDSYDKNHDGKISIDELINAFDDWISGNISTDQFILVFDAWMSS